MQENLKQNGGDFNPDILHDFLQEKNHKEIEIKSITAGIEDCFMELAG